MATTCQSIVDRAEDFSALNAALTSDRTEMLSRIRADQQTVYATVGHALGKRFQTSSAVTSTNGASDRTIALGSLTPPLLRALALVLASGARPREVDVQDQDAKHAPRYYVGGTTLTEVGSDWGASGAISGTLHYVQGPTDIDPAGAYSQTISLPDEWSDLIVLQLAMYLHTKDPGRDPAEYQALQQQFAARLDAFKAYCATYSGDAREVTSE